jgi:MFS family permease
MATVLSATFLSAQDVIATWLLHDLGASFSLSLMATATSTPLLLFALPAGIIADTVNRRNVILSAMVWQVVFTVLMAFGAWTKILSINSVLLCVFALGIGIAFSAPVWSAIIPSIVSKEELPSAVTLGGMQVNIAGLMGPALGGFVLPKLGAPLLISINALIFLTVCLIILRWRPDRTTAKQADQGFMESRRIGRYAFAHQIRIILFRNFLFPSRLRRFLPTSVIVYTELKGPTALTGVYVCCDGIVDRRGLCAPSRAQCPNGITLVLWLLCPSSSRRWRARTSSVLVCRLSPVSLGRWPEPSFGLLVSGRFPPESEAE